ncbi:DUF1592 domain-containing protein [Planctomicrobium piriforme]|uniref:Planctomycete cytochrome C n=1 Tax=Planctomicrobium piriforme TaxID=1576369 RepID=A0A1I3C9W1_9PLAN|nr:DUF1592 domain-containing protein [Planctomicrobium piriforme]SFH71328.1 Planctomycete cytochrome C [Planctomicrobium piriforme]
MNIQRTASLWMLLTVVTVTAARAETPDEAFEKVRPLLVKYCVSCHSAEKKEGGLDLARFDSFAKADEDKKLWDTVLGRFFAREMPPEGSPQPNDPERDELRKWMNSMVKETGACDKIANDRNTNFYSGHVMSRRLTRTEYANSVRDLLGVDVLAVERLPSDGSGGEGFDTVGDSLFLSSIHLEKYIETSDLVAQALWPDKPIENEPARMRQKRDEIAAHVIPEGTAPREVARQKLAPLVRRAFRRPVEPGELDRYLALYDRAVQRGESHLAGMRLALQGILVSPHFLFLAEPEPEKEGIYALPDHPLAARIAMFLWSSLPDDELLAAADAGLLQSDDELKKQVHRMLQDPRARALGDNFAMQWLGLNPLGTTVRPDPNRFPDFTNELAAAMRAETATYFARLFAENRSLVELLDSDYTYVNEVLARHYGLPEVQGTEMQKVSLSDRTRGGVLTQASVLTVSSYPLRTSPVLRGRWLLEEILGSRVPPPPPGVPPLPTEGEGSESLSIREQLEKHRSNPQCASCHSRMDPLGFGLENFDPIGRWRTETAGKPIDATGKLPSGEEFNGPAELKVILLNRKYDVLKHLTRKMYGFAIGRELNKFDDCVIKEAMEKLQKHDFKAEILVEHIVLSYQFRHRYCKK